MKFLARLPSGIAGELTGYAHFGLGLATAIVLWWRYQLSPGVALAAAVVVTVALTLCLLHRALFWIAAVLGTAMGGAYGGLLAWFAGAAATGSDGWATAAAVVGGAGASAWLAATYRRLKS
jgi:hypothetical protein